MNEQDSKWKNSKNYLAPAVAAFGVVCAGLLVCFLLFNGKVIRGYVGLVFARSGMACKRGLAPANKVGVIDADYRGEVMIFLHNHSPEPQVVEDGDRVAQLMIVPYLTAQFAPAEELEGTERGAGGFGSTGRN